MCSGVQILANVPPPPSVTQRLGYWPSQRLRRSGSAVWSLLYGFGAAAVRRPRNRTSSISDALARRHSTPTARGLMPPVKTPRPLSDVGAARRRRESPRCGAPTP